MKDNTTLINEVMDRIPNKYMAVIVASKRARAINDGKRPLVKTGSSKPTTSALAEIAAGVIVPEPKSLEIEAVEEIEPSEPAVEEEEAKQLPPPSDTPETDEEKEKEVEEDKGEDEKEEEEEEK